MKVRQHLSIIHKKDDWATPRTLVHDIMNDYNVRPTLDVCCTKQNALFPNHFTIKDNALTKQWHEPFFMNPPYSEISKWLKYAYEQHLAHNVTGTALIYSKTDTKYWHSYIEGKAEVHFLKGRIRFLDHNLKQSKYPAPYPSCVVIWRSK